MWQSSIINFLKKPEHIPALFCILFCIAGVLAAVFLETGENISPFQEDRVVDYSPAQGKLRPLKLRREGLFEYSCNECHRMFNTNNIQKRRVAEHINLKLDHGRNDYCLNCHHKNNRNAYVTYTGDEISSARPQELCAKCHGTVFRDWEIGAHGRGSGYMDKNKGDQLMLVCTECHAPHSPKFTQLALMPGPMVPGREKGK